MTILTGTLRDPGGNPITGTLWLELSQAGTFNPGAILVTPQVPSVFTLKAGEIEGPGGGPWSVYGNDGITPSLTFYRLTAFDSTGSQVLRLNVVFAGATADFGALTIAPTQSFVAPPEYLVTKIHGKPFAPPPWTPGHVVTVQADQSLAPAAPIVAGGLADGVYGEVTVSVGGTVITVNPGTIATAKMGGDVTAAGKALLDDASNTVQRTTLGLVIGTHVQAQDVELEAIAGLTSAADRLPYFTGPGTAALATFAAWGRSVLAAVDAAATRTLLALGTAAGLDVPVSGDAGSTQVVKGSDSRLLSGVFEPESYGGKADGNYNTAGTMAAGNATLQLSGSPGLFAANDTGKTIAVEGAGVSSGLLVTTITGYTSPTVVTLAAAAGTACVGGWVYWGTDNELAFNNMAAGLPSGARVTLRAGIYLLTRAMAVAVQNCTVQGAGKGATTLVMAATNQDCIQWTVSGTAQVVRDLKIMGVGGAMTAGAAIAYAGGALPYWGSGVSNVFVDRYYDGISSVNYGMYYEMSWLTVQRPVRYGIRFNGIATVVGGLVYAYENMYLARFSISAGAGTVTASAQTFTAHDIGDRLTIEGAGVGGTALDTYITAVASPTSCTVANVASTSAIAAKGGIGSRMQVGWFQTNGGAYINSLDIVGGAKSVFLYPGNGEWIFAFIATNLLCDSPTDIGLQFAQTGSGYGWNLKFNGCWFASAGAQYNLAGGAAVGAQLAVGALDVLQGVTFTGCEFVNNRLGGIATQQVCGLTVTGNLFENSGVQQANLTYGRDLAVQGNRFTHETFGTTNAYCLNMLSAGGAVAVTGNLFRGFSVSATVNVTDNGTSIIVANNATLP